MLRELEPMSQPNAPIGPPEDDPSTPLALAAVRAGDARKAKEVVAMRVGHLTSATNYFVNMQGGSKAQIQAIVKSIEVAMEEQFGRVGKRQGRALSGWVCLDFDEIVVNVFSEQERSFYAMEKFWAAAQLLDLSDVLIPDLAPSPSAIDAPDESDIWALTDEDWTLDSLEGETDWSLSPAEASLASLESALEAVEEPPSLLEEEGDELAGEAWEAIEALRPAGGEGGGEGVVQEPLHEGPAADADWAMGDDSLKQLVDKADGGWRSLMEADGWDLADGDAEAEVDEGFEVTLDDDDAMLDATAAAMLDGLDDDEE